MKWLNNLTTSFATGWGQIRAVLFAILIGSVAILGGISYTQAKKLIEYQATYVEMIGQIRDLKEAAALTDKLRQDNAKLIQQRDNLQRELDNAEGTTEPLSDGIRNILERMRGGR